MRDELQYILACEKYVSEKQQQVCMYVCVCDIGKIPFAQLVRKTRLSTRASSRKMPMRDWNKDEITLSHVYTQKSTENDLF